MDVRLAYGDNGLVVSMPAGRTTVPIRAISRASCRISGVLKLTSQMISHRSPAASLSAKTDCAPYS